MLQSCCERCSRVMDYPSEFRSWLRVQSGGDVRIVDELIYAHPGPTWQVSSREMQVLPQASPAERPLQQVRAAGAG
jgi:hypothetical protein